MSKKIYSKSIAVFILLVTLANNGFCQEYVRAQNVNGSYYCVKGDVFTWTGGCQNGYCSGYGTLQFFTNNIPDEKFVGSLLNGKRDGFGYYYFTSGKRNFEGYFKNNLRNGFGTSYYENGTICYQGYWTDNKAKNQYFLDLIGQAITEYAVTYIFDGGTNVTYRLPKVVYNREGSLQELRVNMKFNGDQNTWMIYEGTMVIKLHPFDIYFVDYNKNFEAYTYIKLGKTILEGIDELLTSSDQ